MIRVQCFIDGFNLYHAVHKLDKPHLKWFNMEQLVSNFVDTSIHELSDIFYFSAYADWLPDAKKRHVQFVEANKHFGVEPIMSQFKEKHRSCRNCGQSWIAHEEKETDVKIAVSLVRNAFLDQFDEAFVVSRDSDLTSAVAVVRHQFPEKNIKIISPPNAGHSKEMAKLVGKKKLAALKEVHLMRSLLPAQVSDEDGNIVAVRPTQYDPPVSIA